MSATWRMVSATSCGVAPPRTGPSRSLHRSSARPQRAPGTTPIAPLDPLEQVAELRHADRHRTVDTCRSFALSCAWAPCRKPSRGQRSRHAPPSLRLIFTPAPGNRASCLRASHDDRESRLHPLQRVGAARAVVGAIAQAEQAVALRVVAQLRQRGLRGVEAAVDVSQFMLPQTLGRRSAPTWGRGRHQAECSWRQSVATSSEAMTAARRSRDDEVDPWSQIGVPGRSAGGADRADPVFHPSNGAPHSNQSPENPGRSSRLTSLCCGAANHALHRRRGQWSPGDRS